MEWRGGQAHSAARGSSRQVHWRETCGAGSRSRPPCRELASAPHPRRTLPPRGEHRGGGPDTRRLWAGLRRAAGGRSFSPRRGNEPNPGRREPLGFLHQPGVWGRGSVSGRSPGPHQSEAGAGSARKGAKPTAQVLIGSDLIRRSHSPDLTQPGPPECVPRRGTRPSCDCGYLAFLLACSGQPGERSLLPVTSSLPRYIAPCVPGHQSSVPG